MEIIRITARWTGFVGAPGYSNFHFATDAGFWDGGLITDEGQIAADAAAQRVRAAFFAVNTRLPSTVTISIEPEAPVINSDTGEMVGSYEVSASSVDGSSTQENYAGPVGAVVNWRTADYRFGRRIRGRTFLVPIASYSYDSDGTLTSGALETLREFADELISDGADPQFGVWSRPRAGSGGVFATVTSGTVPDLSAVLRSRRD